MASAMLAIAAAGVEMLVERCLAGFPYRLFRLLDEPTLAAAGAILRAPSCLRDGFAEKFLEAFPTEEALLSQSSLGILQCAAGLLDTDTAKIECRRPGGGRGSARSGRCGHGHGHGMAPQSVSHGVSGSSPARPRWRRQPVEGTKVPEVSGIPPTAPGAARVARKVPWIMEVCNALFTSAGAGPVSRPCEPQALSRARVREREHRPAGMPWCADSCDAARLGRAISGMPRRGSSSAQPSRITRCSRTAELDVLLESNARAAGNGVVVAGRSVQPSAAHCLGWLSQEAPPRSGVPDSAEPQKLRGRLGPRAAQHGRQ